VFLNVAEDERSDNDENELANELAEEQRLDALAAKQVEAEDHMNGPQVLLNGEPVKGDGKSPSMDGLTNRKFL